MGDQPQTIIIEGDESRPYYAELIVENKEQEHDYNRLEVTVTCKIERTILQVTY